MTTGIDIAVDLIRKRGTRFPRELYFEVIAKEPGGELWLCGICATNVMTKPCPEHDVPGARDLTSAREHYEVWEDPAGGLSVGAKCGRCPHDVSSKRCSEHGRIPPRPRGGRGKRDS